MIIRYFITLTILIPLLTGCVSTAPEYSLGQGKTAFIERDLIGTFEGAGILKTAQGKVERSFTTVLTGQKDGSAVYLREKYFFDTGDTEEFTYRITPSDSPFKYDCVRVETLDKCRVERAGGSIMLDITFEELDFMQAKVTNAKHIFHFLGGGKVIKNTYYNKFLFLHDKDEITHYTRVLQ